MNRGIIELNKSEIEILLKVLIEAHKEDGLIFNKLSAAFESVEESLGVQISEDELEMLLDEILPVTFDTDPNLKSAIEKIQLRLRQFRG